MNIEEIVQKEDVVDKSFTRLKKYKILRGRGLVGWGVGGGGVKQALGHVTWL